ncbi:MAG: hypothetical protein Q8O86_02615 [Dehalococcoidia bacterium]|nr:hypothetical protein [Dehalococcoidia bacterium]
MPRHYTGPDLACGGDSRIALTLRGGRPVLRHGLRRFTKEVV